MKQDLSNLRARCDALSVRSFLSYLPSYLPSSISQALPSFFLIDASVAREVTCIVTCFERLNFGREASRRAFELLRRRRLKNHKTAQLGNTDNRLGCDTLPEDPATITDGTCLHFSLRRLFQLIRWRISGIAIAQCPHCTLFTVYSRIPPCIRRRGGVLADQQGERAEPG